MATVSKNNMDSRYKYMIQLTEPEFNKLKEILVTFTKQVELAASSKFDESYIKLMGDIVLSR